MALPARIDPSHHTGLVQISTTRAPLHGARAGADRVEIQSLRAPAKPGELRLAEIRPFAFRGKHYVFVVPVTGIFEISELAAEIIGLFLTTAASDGKPVYTAASVESRSLVAQQVVNALLGRHTVHSIVQGLSELQTLGVLLTEDGSEPVQPVPFLPKLSGKSFPQRSLVLNVANDCNLGCTYCFASQGDYGAPKKFMSLETARESVDFLLQNSGDHPTVTLVFFGGEPLMNFRLISDTVAYATRAGELAGKEVEFSMTTNATYLTPQIIHFLRDHRVGVAVSIDGPKKFHDLRRTYKNGMGSYDMIEPRVMNLLREHKTRPIAARVTLTHGVTAVGEIFDHLTEMGFDEVGFAPVTSSDDDDYALTPEELWQVLEEFGKLTARYVDGVSSSERPRFSNLTNLLADLHQGVIKAYPCGAGLGLLGVGSTGKLYLCHRFLESDEHQVGTLATGVDRAKQADFMAVTHLSAKPPCQICWVRNICAGGCHHEGYKRYGTLGHATTHRCEWIRAWTNMGLHAYVEIMERNPAFLERIEKGQE
jgi:uncharacterized protein